MTGPCPSRTSTCPSGRRRRGRRCSSCTGARPRAGTRSTAGQLTVRRMHPFARDLAALGDDLAVAQLRYRIRGWNDNGVDALADVAFALAALDARYGGVPTVLVGHSMGGRAALRSAASSGRARRGGPRAVAPRHRTGRAARRPRPRGAARHPRPHHQPASVGAVRDPGAPVRPPGGVPAGAVERSRHADARVHLAADHRRVRRRHRRRRAVRPTARPRPCRAGARRHRRAASRP